MAIKKPNIQTIKFRLTGISPYVQARFGAKARQSMMAKMASGSKAKKGTAREPRDFDADCEESTHRTAEGWIGMPASAFRNALISACRLVGFKMTLAKLSVFVEADGFDAVDASPLVRIIGDPERFDATVRNATGVADIRVRPMWREWTADLRISYDGDQFSADDITNLMERVGRQVGVGEGRPDSKSSAGLGWGMFSVKLVA